MSKCVLLMEVKAPAKTVKTVKKQKNETKTTKK